MSAFPAPFPYSYGNSFAGNHILGIHTGGIENKLAVYADNLYIIITSCLTRQF